MKSPRLLLVSVGVNVLLLFALGWQTYRVRPHDGATNGSSLAGAGPIEELPSSERAERSQRPSELSKSAPQSSGSTQPVFHWRQLESTNYLTYIKNLRAAGCPEQTIRDIVTADLNATFAARRDEVVASRFQNYKFWETGTTPNDVKAELKRQKDSLDAELQQAVQELLGPDGVAPSTTRDWHMAELNQQLGFLSAEKQSAALALLLRNEANDALIKRLSEARRPTENSDELYRILQTYEGKRTELARLLSPQEFEQLELTVSWTADNLRRGMAKFNPTEAEFREIFRAWRLHDENLAQLYATGQPDPGNSHVFAKIKETLGEERYKQYKSTWWK